jgi:putative oligomerization/nucleic acid binding protein
MSRGINRRVAAGLLCLVCLGLSGCFIISDNSNDPQNPTVGRELRDLKMARENGALDPDEYEQARHRLLSRLDKPCKS